jgi:hypothetical protein
MKRGRPVVPRAEARVHSIACRLTDSELEKLDAWRGKNSRGAWLRLAAFQRAPRPIPAVNVEMWGELARLHSNLNQLNREVHEKKEGLAGVHIKRLRQLVPQLFLQVVDLRAELIGQPTSGEIEEDESSC